MNTMLPLPLELTRPVESACDPEATLKQLFELENTKYNPLTQVRENAEGVPMLYNGLRITVSVLVSTVAILGTAGDSDNNNDDH